MSCRRVAAHALAWTLAATVALGCALGGKTSGGTAVEAQPAATTSSPRLDPIDTPSPTPTTATAALGEKLQLTSTYGDGTESVVDITVSDLKVGVKAPYMKAEKGQYIVVRVTILCRQGKHSANPFDFKFVAPDGSVSDPEYGVAKPQLESVDLAAAQKTTGLLAFDVEVDAQTGGRVALKDFIQGDLGYWLTG